MKSKHIVIFIFFSIFVITHAQFPKLKLKKLKPSDPQKSWRLSNLIKYIGGKKKPIEQPPTPPRPPKSPASKKRKVRKTKGNFDHLLELQKSSVYLSTSLSEELSDETK